MGGIDMPNLGGWYPQMVFETITNERGNEIYIAVEDGLKGVHIVIRGPESEATNTITRLEAKALLRCLSDAVDRRSTPPSVTDEMVERIATIIDPRAFVGTPEEIHMYCSPVAVEYVQAHALARAREIVAALAAMPGGVDWRNEAQSSEGSKWVT